MSSPQNHNPGFIHEHKCNIYCKRHPKSKRNDQKESSDENNKNNKNNHDNKDNKDNKDSKYNKTNKYAQIVTNKRKNEALGGGTPVAGGGTRVIAHKNHGNKKDIKEQEQIHRIEKARRKLDVSTMQEIFMGFEQGRILGQGCFGATWSLKPMEGVDWKTANRKLPAISQKLDQNQSSTENMSFCIKVSCFDYDEDGRYKDSFLREIEFLRLLRTERVVPTLIADRWIVDPTKPDTNKGIQMMERYDGNAKQLGMIQAQQIGYKDHNVNAFTWKQIEQMIELALYLDLKGLIHGDFKLSNILYKRIVRSQLFSDIPMQHAKEKGNSDAKFMNGNSESMGSGEERKEVIYDFRICDFGFAGYLHSNPQNANHTNHTNHTNQQISWTNKNLNSYHNLNQNQPQTQNYFSPLVGFMGNFGCSTKRIKGKRLDVYHNRELPSFSLDEEIPPVLHSVFNRCQLYICLMETTRLYIYQHDDVTNQIFDKTQLRECLGEAMGLTSEIRLALLEYCPKLDRSISHVEKRIYERKQKELEREKERKRKHKEIMMRQHRKMEMMEKTRKMDGSHQK